MNIRSELFLPLYWLELTIGEALIFLNSQVGTKLHTSTAQSLDSGPYTKALGSSIILDISSVFDH